MNKAVLFAFFSALLSTALCVVIDCWSKSRCTYCHGLFEEWHNNRTVLEKREKFWKLWHCGGKGNMKPMYPCVEKLCENWDKNIVELKFGTDVNKFCKSVNMC